MLVVLFLSRLVKLYTRVQVIHSHTTLPAAWRQRRAAGAAHPVLRFRIPAPATGPKDLAALVPTSGGTHRASRRPRCRLRPPLGNAEARFGTGKLPISAVAEVCKKILTTARSSGTPCRCQCM